MRAAFDGWHGLMLLNPRKLPMPDAGGRTSSVKTWLRLYTDAKLDIYIFYLHLHLRIKNINNSSVHAQKTGSGPHTLLHSATVR